MAVMIVASVLQMARETSSQVERGFKPEVGSVGRSVFSHTKISSHHIHRCGEANNFLGVQCKALLFPL